MPTTETAEFYFIAGAFVLILIVCAVAAYVFFRQLKREKSNTPADEPRNKDRDNASGEEE
ncbi:MAG TPA: hypothetical protein VMM38_07110 [Aridibacter sp.]|nr:hypothetical protein [Aridibacter sp.]